LRRRIALFLVFALFATLIPSATSFAGDESKVIYLRLSEGTTSPGSKYVFAPNKDLAEITLDFTVQDLMGYTYLEVKGNQSYNLALLEPGEGGFKNINVNKQLTGHTELDPLKDFSGSSSKDTSDSSSSVKKLSEIVQDLVQTNFGTIAKRLTEPIGTQETKDAIRWDKLQATDFVVQTTPVYFAAKTVSATGIRGTAIIKSNQVTLKALGLDLGPPESADSNSGAQDPALDVPSGTSAFSPHPHAKITFRLSASIDGVVAYEEDTGLYTPLFSVFQPTGIGAYVSGQKFDVASMLDHVRPGEKLELEVMGKYLSGDISGGFIPEEAQAKLPIPVLVFTLTFSNDTIALGVRDDNTKFMHVLSAGAFGSKNVDTFLANVPQEIPMSIIDNPIRRGYTYAGVLVNAQAFYNDMTDFGLWPSFGDKLEEELLPIATAAVKDFEEIDPNTRFSQYGKYEHLDPAALANYLAGKLTSEIKKVLEQTYGGNAAGGTSQSEGSGGARVVDRIRYVPHNSSEQYTYYYNQHYKNFMNAKSDLDRQEALKAFDSEVRKILVEEKPHTLADISNFWFNTIHPLHGINLRLKQEDRIRGTGYTLFSDLPSMDAQIRSENATTELKNRKATDALLFEGLKNFFTFISDFFHDFSAGQNDTDRISSPELMWLDMQYTQLVDPNQNGGKIKGVIAFTNYGDVPITNFPVRLYVFDAVTNQKLIEKNLGYVWGNEYEFSVPQKKVTIDSSLLIPPDQNFPKDMKALKDVDENIVTFFKPGVPVKIPIEFTYPTGAGKDHLVLVAVVGAKYTTALTKDDTYRYYEYLFEPDRYKYFKAQDEPSMLVGFTPNKILTREIEAKYGGGLFAAFSITNSLNAEIQRQVTLSNSYNDPWSVPANELKPSAKVTVLKPYDLTIGKMTETTTAPGGYWVPGKYLEIYWERTIWNEDPRKR